MSLFFVEKGALNTMLTEVSVIILISRTCVKPWEEIFIR